MGSASSPPRIQLTCCLHFRDLETQQSQKKSQYHNRSASASNDFFIPIIKVSARLSHFAGFVLSSSDFVTQCSSPLL
ncbi:hypothetical protein CDAR_554901, partial [Caerostris darwini]